MSDNELDLEDIPAETPLSPEEAILRRHRREKKELQGKIVAMKKNSNKHDKKKKKELADEIAKLEAEMEARHKAELDAFRPKRQELPPAAPAEVKEEEAEGKPSEVAADKNDDEDQKRGKQSKAAKRREKKAAQERERQHRVDQETAELLEGADWKKEDTKLAELLSDMKLEVHDIQSDGHCLYRAVSHQLELFNEKMTLEELRSQTAQFLREHKDEFINYLDEADGNSDAGFEEYCNAVADTAAWGGQIELRALSQVLKRPVKVIQADGPLISFGEDFPRDPLVLTYHRHKYKLGAHYNSVVPATGKASEEES